MPSRTHGYARLASWTLAVTLIVTGIPHVVQGARLPASTLLSAPYATQPHDGSVGAHPAPRARLYTVDDADRHLGYRLVGDLVQQSTDGGANWSAILNTGGHARKPLGGCQPARYRAVTALAVAALLPGTLFVATSGDLGGVPSGWSDFGCATATGGLYILRPDGQGGTIHTDSLAAGLPFAQDPAGRTPRAYTIYDLTTDPANPDILYADAAPSQPRESGPDSPPAGLYRTTNGGLYWSPAMSGLPHMATGAPRGVLSINPAQTAIIFDVIGTTLYRSANRGGYWADVRGIAARRSLRLFINPANPNLVYALSDVGLFHSGSAGRRWSPVTDRRIPAARHIRALSFDPRDPSSFIVMPDRGAPIRVREARAPAAPRFDPTLALSPQRGNRAILAVHAAPYSSVRLDLIAGAQPTSARITTNAAGVGYASLRLTGQIVRDALRVRVRLGAHSQIVIPWLQPGWTPGQVMGPRDAGTPTATITAPVSATATLTPTVAPQATAPVTPTAYAASSLTAMWTWRQITRSLPLCPPTTVVTATTATTTSSPAIVITPVVLATATATTAPTGTVAPAPVLPAHDPTAALQIKPHDVLTATATFTPTTSATAAPATPTPSLGPISTIAPPQQYPGPCDAGPPTPRQDYAIGWDNAAHRLYVFGGTDSKTAASYNDISAFSTITNSWIALTPPSPLPSRRYGASAVWNPALSMFLVFGGMYGAGPWARFNNELWGYIPSSNTWTNLSPTTTAPNVPSPRAHAAAAWDAANNRLLIFGGETNDSATPTLTNDLWAYTFSGASGSWSLLSPNGGSQNLPPPRQWASIAWDTPYGALHLYGGKDPGSGSMSDTWTWSPLSGWQYDSIPDQPPGRQAGAYFWDDTHQRLVVGPGLSMLGNSTDVWEYDVPTHDWLQVPALPAPAPAPRQMTRMVWDAADNQALMFGGRQAGVGVVNDLWALVPTGVASVPAATPAAGHIVKAADIGQVVSRSSDKVLLKPDKVQRLATSGATYARVSFYIGDGHQSWTPSRLQAYEKVITMLTQKGIAVLGVAGSGITGNWSAASWLQNANETSGGNGENPAIDDYVQQFQTLVEHFYPAPYSVRYWEVWNEPNVPLAGCTILTIACLQQPSLHPSNFAALLALAFKAVKGNSAISDVQIVSGGIFGHSIGGAYNAIASGAAYIASTYDEGINKTGLWQGIRAQFNAYPIDLIGEHLYVDQGQRTTPAVVRTYLDWFHTAYATFEGASKGTMLTEVGWRTGDSLQPQVSQDMQALNLDTVFATAKRTGYVKALYWFELQDDPGYNHNTSWGLLDRNGNAKLAFQHFQGQ